VPAGAVSLSGGDNWNWVTANPAPNSGTVAHQSNLAAGLHEHFFNYAGATLTPAAGEVLFAYVYLDPANLPSEIMLSWNAGDWEHRAYWGANSIGYGTDGSASRRKVGALPAAGQWVRLEVPASDVGLEGKTITGMGFSEFNGRATWDNTGKSSASLNTTTTTPVASTASDVIWSDDAVPAGAVSLTGGDNWNWTNSPAPISGATAHQSNLASGLHEHFFNYASVTLTPAAGEVLFAYVYLDPANLPSEIMLSWNANNWEHRAYWGANLISYGTDGSASRHNMGALPAAGQWVRLEVPASVVGLEGQTLTGMGFSQFNGRATWDKTGKAATTSTSTGSGSTTTPPATTTPTPVAGIDTLWFDDSIPAGATAMSGGDDWNWTNSPAPASGATAHQSNLAAGLHEHFFNYASATLTPAAGEVLFTYVYLDPANTPSEIMLAWNSNGWEHRAYWGANSINYGTNSTAGRRYIGALPAAGQWVRLEVPASAVDLEGKPIDGMGFSEFGGRATWDKTGKSTAASSTSTSTTPTTPVVTPPVDTTPVVTTPVVTPPVVITPVVTPPVVTTPTDTSSTLPATTAPTTATGGANAAVLGSANVEDTALQLPNVGDNLLHVLSPTMLELKLINTKPAGSTQPSVWNFVDASGNLSAPAGSKFTVTVNGQAVSVQAVGFKRRVLYAPLQVYDLRVENSLYLQIATAVADGQRVEVTNPDTSLWGTDMKFVATADPMRASPAIHVNQEGYVPSLPKKAMIGYYLGDMGEMTITPTSYAIIDARTGAVAYTGSLVLRQDAGYNLTPAPYQKVMMADFSDFKTPGEYMLQVAGLGQ
jgi:hypothetical protein